MTRDKHKLAFLSGCRVREGMSDIQEEAYTELCLENERLKVILIRAADALQDLDRFAFYCWSCRNEKLPELIAELRKEAE